MIRVYQFALRPPVENEPLARAQLLAAHRYRNQHVAIERGRRWAVRLCEASEEVDEAVALVQSATKSTRKDALKDLRAARKAARETHADELARIAELDAEIRRNARSHTSSYWGSYLTIEQSSDQVRRMPIYEPDGLTPSDPRFVRWTGAGQIGVQLQGGALTPDVLAGRDTRIRLIDGVLWLRVGSEGRDPIWAKWPIVQHREIPSGADWKWARVSLRKEGPWERWSCEITLEIPGEHPRNLDKDPQGAIAVEVTWDKPGDALVVARWRDDAGRTGTIELSEYDEQGIRKPDGIRSVRDQLLNDLKKRLPRAYAECRGDLGPPWLGEAIDGAQYWRSQSRAHTLLTRWRAEKCDAARAAYEILDAWWLRDMHLWEYEAGARGQALRRRREKYRVLAVTWSREYRHVILDDRVLSREARFGDASDLRFTAGPSELRQCLEHAFGGRNGGNVTTHPVRDDAAKSETEERDWCERAIDAWIAGGARATKKVSESTGVKGGAWSLRKSKKSQKQAENGTAREPVAKGAV